MPNERLARGAEAHALGRDEVDLVHCHLLERELRARLPCLRPDVHAVHLGLQRRESLVLVGQKLLGERGGVGLHTGAH